jgi:hypothetical protein
MRLLDGWSQQSAANLFVKLYIPSGDEFFLEILFVLSGSQICDSLSGSQQQQQQKQQ